MTEKDDAMQLMRQATSNVCPERKRTDFTDTQKLVNELNETMEHAAKHSKSPKADA